MRRPGWTPSIVPNGDDQNVYIVVDDFRAETVGLTATTMSSGPTSKQSSWSCSKGNIKTYPGGRIQHL
jgi:hypothetical protein